MDRSSTFELSPDETTYKSVVVSFRSFTSLSLVTKFVSLFYLEVFDWDHYTSIY